MSTTATRPVALRMSDAEKARLLRHGGTARAAVTRLLDLADEHETCEPPRKRTKPTGRAADPMRLEPVPTSTRQQSPVSTQQQGERTYEVQVAGRTVLRTKSKARADKAAKAAQERYPKRMVEVR